MGAVRKGLNWLSWGGAGLIVVALLLKAFFFDIAEVGHNGMAPTLLRQERVLINKRAQPSLGSIAVCQHPTEEGWVVARVGATGGMTIESFGKQLFIDDEPLEFRPDGSGSFYNADTDRKVEVAWGYEDHPQGSHLIFMGRDGKHHVKRTEVPEGKLYLLGDYRGYLGQDSRAYGVVDASTCRGTIVFRLIPSEELAPEIEHGYFQVIR